MIATVVRAAWFAAIYLLVLNSAAPGDLAVGGALGLAAAVGLRPRDSGQHPEPPLVRMRAAAGMLLQTASEMVRGTWATARFCLGAATGPGLVEIPRGDRSAANVAMWAVLTGEAPDEYPVDVDPERDLLLVHVLEAGDPDAVRARHRRSHERWQRKVVP